MKKIVLSAFLAAALLLCGCNKTLSRSNVLDPNYNAGGTGFVEGYVKDSNSGGLASAFLSYNNGAFTTTPNGSDGHYSFSNAPAGNLPLTASCNWYTSSTQNVTLYPNASMHNINFTLQSGRPSTYFPCNFDSLSQGSLGSPWLTSTAGTGTVNVAQAGFNHSGLQSCKMTVYSASDDAQMKYTGLNALKGAKASAYFYIDNYGSASNSLKLQDSYGNGPEIGVASSAFYYKNNNGAQTAIGGLLPSASTWYQFAISYETDTGTIMLSINNTSGSSLYSTTITPANYISSLDRLVIENKGTAAGNTNAYIDDVDLVKK